MGSPTLQRIHSKIFLCLGVIISVPELMVISMHYPNRLYFVAVTRLAVTAKHHKLLLQFILAYEVVTHEYLHLPDWYIARKAPLPDCEEHLLVELGKEASRLVVDEKSVVPCVVKVVFTRFHGVWGRHCHGNSRPQHREASRGLR